MGFLVGLFYAAQHACDRHQYLLRPRGSWHLTWGCIRWGKFYPLQRANAHVLDLPAYGAPVNRAPGPPGPPLPSARLLRLRHHLLTFSFRRSTSKNKIIINNNNNSKGAVGEELRVRSNVVSRTI